ncbi:MAG: hypothetical protein AB7V04_06160 [Desulfomonilaceae bacterium]
MINTFKIYNKLRESMEPDAAEAVVDALGSMFEELQNSVKKTEFNELKDIVKQLADRLDDLAVKIGQLTSNISRL